MKDKLKYYTTVDNGKVTISDMPDLKNPENMILLEARLSDLPELMATLKAKKNRGKFKYEYHRNLVLVYTGLRAVAIQPYLYPNADNSKHYCAVHANEFYVPSIIRELENL